MRAHGLLLPTAALALLPSACGRPRDATPRDQIVHKWAQVFKDAEYQVSLDTAHIEPIPEGGYLVWYETQHARPKVEAGKRWNREIIRSLLRCDPLSFKTVRITVHYGDGPSVARRGGEIEDVADKPWKPVIPGSVDEGAMGTACAIIRSSLGSLE